MPRVALPTGTVTFLFSDIEGSTTRWEAYREAMKDAVRRHDAIVRGCIERNAGHVFKTVGDAFCATFADPSHAVQAALEAQRSMGSEDWNAVDGLKVRMAIHTGVSDERDGDYFGPAVNRVARIMAIVHGGQVVLSDVTSRLVSEGLPAGTTLLDLGAHRLKDLAEPERLHQLVAPDLARDFPMLRSLETLPNNLPQQLTSFIGREEEVAAVKALVGESRLVTLVGAGGIGKTRLSLQVAADLLDSYADGSWFVELAPLRDPERVPNAVAAVLGVRESADRSVAETLVKTLRPKKLLLVLDNCEHVLDAVATLITAIARECSEVRILATSRQPLGITGEQVHRVSSLTVPHQHASLSREDALQYGAVALFADRARAATETFELTDDNAATVAQICERLDGIALAIELATPRLRVLSLEHLAQRLSERFRLLTGGSRDALPRQQTMHALIDWSYDLLDEEEQSLFRRLCVFVGDFSLEAASAIGASDASDDWRVLELLSSLVDKSLVTSELRGSARRYRLLESMRAYALEKAGELNEVAALRARHAEYYALLAERAQAAFAGTPATQWERDLMPELEQFRVALDWSLGERMNPELGSRLLGALRQFWNAIGIGATICRWTELALAEDVAPPLQATLCLTLGFARSSLSLPKQAFAAFSRARQLYEALDDRAGLAESLRAEGYAQTQFGAFAEANASFGRALALSREVHDRRGIATTQSAIASGLYREGRPAEARAAALEAAELMRTLGDERTVGGFLMNIAEMEFQLGEVESALARANENLQNETFCADGAARVNQQVNLSAYLFALDRLDEAKSEACGALGSARDLENHVVVGQALQHLAAILAQSDPKRAARLLGYVEGAFAATGFVREYTERFTCDRLMTSLRKTLSEEEIAALARDGAALTEEQAADLAQHT